VVVEAESSKIGDRMVPPAIWQPMAAAPRIVLTAPAEARARYLVQAYGEIIADRAALEDAFTRLPVYPARKRLESWRKLADAGAFEELALALMELHYDPAYARSSRKETREVLGEIALDTVDPAGLDAAAARIAQLVG
jgi:tRNA 2-selenouridine synthase